MSFRGDGIGGASARVTAEIERYGSAWPLYQYCQGSLACGKSPGVSTTYGERALDTFYVNWSPG